MPSGGELSISQLKKSPLWDHLQDVIAYLILEKPNDPALTRFSYLINAGNMVPTPRTTPYQEERAKRQVKVEKASPSCAQILAQLKPPVREKKDDDDVEPEEEEEKPNLPDPMAAMEIFKWCGVGLPTSEVFQVKITMKKLLEAKPLDAIRFWGKITGIRKDYYIFEGSWDPNREEDAAEPEVDDEDDTKFPIYQQLNTYKAKATPPIAIEPKGIGTNKYVYFASTSDNISQCSELPDVQPHWIIAARKVKKYFTGDLEALVQSHPPFPGVEKHFLRAQIARITHCTVIAPKDVFALENPPDEPDDTSSAADGEKKRRPYKVEAYEEIPEVIPNTDVPEPDDDNEDYKALQMWAEGYLGDALLKLGNWVHLLPEILQTQGRASLWKPDPDDNEVDDVGSEDEKPPPPIEKINPRLSDLQHDRKLKFPHHNKAAHPCWSARKVFSLSSSTHRIYTVKSHVWCGAITSCVCVDGVPGAIHDNLYIGNGMKRGKVVTAVFSPVLPPALQSEYQGTGTSLLQVDATPDDEQEFAKPPEPVVANEGDDDSDNEEED